MKNFWVLCGLLSTTSSAVSWSEIKPPEVCFISKTNLSLIVQHEREEVIEMPLKYEKELVNLGFRRVLRYDVNCKYVLSSSIDADFESDGGIQIMVGELNISLWNTQPRVPVIYTGYKSTLLYESDTRAGLFKGAILTEETLYAEFLRDWKKQRK